MSGQKPTTEEKFTESINALCKDFYDTQVQQYTNAVTPHEQDITSTMAKASTRAATNVLAALETAIYQIENSIDPTPPEEGLTHQLVTLCNDFKKVGGAQEEALNSLKETKNLAEVTAQSSSNYAIRTLD